MSSTTTASTESIAAAAPPGQDARLGALHAYSILDTPVESSFDDITLIASHICRTPIAVINLIDASRQWFKSERGLGVRETPLETSICAHAILEHEYLEVPDTTADPRFARNPLVTGDPGLRFYAGALLRTPDGHAIGTVCVLDYEPRKLDDEQRAVLFALARQTMAQLELRRGVLDARRSRQTHQRVVALAGENLSAPLSVIEVALFHATDAVKDDVDLSNEVKAAREASRQLMGNFRRMSEALRIDKGTVEQTRIDIADFVSDVADRWLVVADRSGRELRIDAADGVVNSDPKRLRSILDNLLGNAFKHAQDGPVLLRVRHENHATVFSVEDSGAGIPGEQHARIFDAFHQLKPTRDGLGMGLSIVQRNAELLGATVSVDSAPGAGAIFRVRLPATD